MSDQELYPANDITEFLGIWNVEVIDDGPVVITDTWARENMNIALFRNYNQVCMFGDTGFAFNSYEQFHFEYDDGFLVSKKIAPGVNVKVGFSDKALTKIYFSFTGRGGGKSGGIGNPNTGGWGGGGSDNP